MNRLKAIIFFSELAVSRLLADFKTPVTVITKVLSSDEMVEYYILMEFFNSLRDLFTVVF